jgi:hypothetical protein
MRFTVRISVITALATAPGRKPAISTSEVAGAVNNSTGAVVSGAAVTMMAARSTL